MPLNCRRTISAGCALAALAITAPAQAASSGVHLDPNSPAAKEYAIPFVSARTQGNAAAASTPAATSPPRAPTTPAAPAADSGLFGAGISRATHARKVPQAKVAAAPPAGASPTALTASDRQLGSGGGGSSATFWIGAALAVLIPGLAVGLGVRRWRRA
ncbi:MAG: hypothetical protein ACR2KV_10285 [Solirubrobacteraceae bacterium]